MLLKKKYVNLFKNLVEKDHNKLHQLSNKYLFEIKDDNTIDTKSLKKSFLDFYNKAINQFSEQRLVEELKITYHRNYYAQKNLSMIFKTNITNLEEYDIKNGLKETVLSSDKINPVHPDFYTTKILTTHHPFLESDSDHSTSSDSDSSSRNKSEQRRRGKKRLYDLVDNISEYSSIKETDSDPVASTSKSSPIPAKKTKLNIPISTSDDFLDFLSTPIGSPDNSLL